MRAPVRPGGSSGLFLHSQYVQLYATAAGAYSSGDVAHCRGPTKTANFSHERGRFPYIIASEAPSDLHRPNKYYYCASTGSGIHWSVH